MKGFHLIPENTKIDFVRFHLWAFVLSVLIVGGAIALIGAKGLNFGIDFTGGTLIEIRTETTPDLSALRGGLNALGLGAVSLQEFGQPNDLLIRLPEQSGTGEAGQQAAIESVRALLEEHFGSGDVSFRRVEFVGPQVGGELKRQGLYAVLGALIGILAYVWFRFEWQFGVAAVIALAHDVIATVGLFALMQWNFDLSTLAAILMIGGYSINDTVVVFDRVRENLRKYKKASLAEVCNKALNETLSRTLLTGGTTLLALLSLWIFGGEVIRGFVDALIFGVIIGTFSSVYIAAPALIYLRLRRDPEMQTETEGAIS